MSLKTEDLISSSMSDRDLSTCSTSCFWRDCLSVFGSDSGIPYTTMLNFLSGRLVTGDNLVVGNGTGEVFHSLICLLFLVFFYLQVLLFLDIFEKV